MVSPLAGALLDRHGRVRLVALDYLVAAAALGTIAALAAIYALNKHEFNVSQDLMLLGMGGGAQSAVPEQQVDK